MDNQKRNFKNIKEELRATEIMANHSNHHAEIWMSRNIRGRKDLERQKRISKYLGTKESIDTLTFVDWVNKRAGRV